MAIGTIDKDFWAGPSVAQINGRSWIVWEASFGGLETCQAN